MADAMKQSRSLCCRGPDPGLWRWRTTRRAAALEDLDDNHTAAAARAERAPIGCSAGRIGGVVRRRRLCRQRDGDQLLCARDVGFAGGTGEQAVMADAVEPLGQDVEQETPDEL